ncbi:hypothetical protein C8R43DRAFT_494706 [Mycena crocata]|nr:hypothetical protein C8R43DRAFT_494706 [Mycena crocata]
MTATMTLLSRHPVWSFFLAVSVLLVFLSLYLLLGTHKLLLGSLSPAYNARPSVPPIRRLGSDSIWLPSRPHLLHAEIRPHDIHSEHCPSRDHLNFSTCRRFQLRNNFRECESTVSHYGITALIVAVTRILSAFNLFNPVLPLIYFAWVTLSVFPESVPLS